MEKYKLSKQPQENRNKFIVTIKADSNDADYVTESEFFTKKSFDDYVVDELINLKTNYGGHHMLKDYPNDGDLSIPFNGYDGYCHTLESLDIKYVDENGETWNDELNLGEL
jgi:hypothetical protein